MSTAVTSRAGLNYHNSGTFEGLGAAGTGPSWEFMIRPIICPNPVPARGEHQVGGGSPTKLGSPQGEGEMVVMRGRRAPTVLTFSSSGLY